jgi:TRAP-type C4-dicarboxylate transport system permease small subunit
MSGARNAGGHGRGGLAALDRLLDRLCWSAAALAGFSVLGVSAVVAASITMRAVGLGSVRGDFEIVSIGCGVAAFLFLPLCQWRRGHIAVDLFSNGLPQSWRDALDGAWELVFAVTWIVLGWRLLAGLLDTYEYQDRSMLLRLPLWTVHVPALFGAVLSALVGMRLSAALWRGEGPPRGVIE